MPFHFILQYKVTMYICIIVCLVVWDLGHSGMARKRRPLDAVGAAPLGKRAVNLSITHKFQPSKIQRIWKN